MKKKYMQMAVSLAKKSMDTNKGGPFGCVIVKDGEVIGKGSNCVTSGNDPTAHAEIVAIRNACTHLNDFQLTGCDVYTSCEPCPMCLGAIYWARPDHVYFAATREDAADAGFDDEFIYRELRLDVKNRFIPMKQLERNHAKEVFELWKKKIDKVEY